MRRRVHVAGLIGGALWAWRSDNFRDGVLSAVAYSQVSY